MHKILKDNKIAFGIGALVGFAITRLPVMKDGNLLVTNICTLVFGTSTVIIWSLLKRFRKWVLRDSNPRPGD